MESDMETTDAITDTSRIEAFSDNVFGVAMTLLAIEIIVPANSGHSNAELGWTLMKLWPKYLICVNTFFTVLLMWVAHHRLFNLLKQTSKPLMLANGFILLLVALVPFPSKILGDYIDSRACPMAVVFYTGYFILINIAFNILVYVAAREKIFIQRVTCEQLVILRTHQKIGFVVTVLMSLLAWFFPLASLIICAANSIYWGLFTKF